jgi:Ni/Fe-hydrogenase subunit HybB-like protein
MTARSDHPTFSIRRVLEGAPAGRNTRVVLVKSVLWFLTGMAAAIAVARFFRGLGSVTALTDTTPWGLWIGFDVLSGVALAAGGFVVAATVHVFHLKRYKPLLRPAVLTAFLGYVAVVLGLIFDLGLAWNLWRPMFFWQHHSALFEVAWCVMLYLTVLALEFAPVVFEKMPFPRIYKFFKRITLPLVILGIMLSTLHQSSLGSLFLIMPFRLHPLWYSPLLPQLFFISAIGLGLAMVTVESRVTGWMYKRQPEENLLQGFARAASWMLFIYLLVRLTDLAVRGNWIYLARPEWETLLFYIEILLSAAVPALLFAVPRWRKSRAGLTTGAVMVVSGFILYRINVSGIATITVTGSRYFPMWTEFAISLGIVSFIALVFFFIVERFDVYGENEEAEPDSNPMRVPAEDPVSRVRLATPWAGPASLYSLVFIVAVAATAGLLPSSVFSGVTPIKHAVHPVRLVTAEKVTVGEKPYDVLKLKDPAEAGNPGEGQTLKALLMDPDRNGRYVVFDHDGHAERAEEKDGCIRCHHKNRPLDNATPCSGCHRDVFLATNIFNHELHVNSAGGNNSCQECHTDASRPRSFENSIACISCHKEWDRPEETQATARTDRSELMAPGYMDAMHTLCVKCHEETAAENTDLGPDFGRCGTCHAESDITPLKSLSPYANIRMHE